MLSIKVKKQNTLKNEYHGKVTYDKIVEYFHDCPPAELVDRILLAHK